MYAEGGLNSDVAKKYGIYGFKMPSFVVVDKDGKIASKPIYNLGEPEFIEVMTKVTGVNPPQAPQAELKVGPEALAPTTEQVAPTK